MKHLHERPLRKSAGRSLRIEDPESVESREDHHNNDEPSEDHCRDEEGSAILHEPRHRILS